MNDLHDFLDETYPPKSVRVSDQAGKRFSLCIRVLTLNFLDIVTRCIGYIRVNGSGVFAEGFALSKCEHLFAYR
jgi:hypothetical protein